MKIMRKIGAIFLTLVMMLSMTVTAFAAEETGSITINKSANVSVAGKTFNAYRILNVENFTETTGEVEGTVVYTVPDELKTFYSTRYRLEGDEGDFDAQVVKKISLEEDMFAFAADALAAAKTAKITPKTATAGEADTSVVIDKLPLGYYVIEDVGSAKPISALILDTTNPSVTVNIKADKPSIDKKIDGNNDTDDGTTGDVQYNNAAIGDKIPYKLTSKVPDMTGYTKYYFVVTDTLSKGLTFNEDVAITVGSKELVKDTDFTVTSTSSGNGTVVEIIFKNFIQYKTEEYKSADIVITYSATLNNNAVIGTEGNPNKVKLTYSNNPNITDDGTSGNPDKPTDNSPVGETPEVETRTFVTGVKIIKVDPQRNRLTRAEFKIEGRKLNTVLVKNDEFTEDEDGEYWKLKDGSYTTDDPTTEGIDPSKYESTGKKYNKTTQVTPIIKEENVEYTATVGKNGELIFDGLAAGSYKITEITAPAGYNLLKAPIDLKITFTAPAEESATCTWGYTWTCSGDDQSNISNNSTNTITITNQSGTELPSTGGIGTTIFYIVGSILVVIAGVLLIARRRMQKN